MSNARDVSIRETLLVIAAFSILAVLMTWPLVRHFTTGVPHSLSDPLLNAWVLAWDADRLLHGLRGWGDAPVFYPYRGTLAHTEHLLGIALFTAPVNWLTGRPLAAYNFGFILSYVVAGTAMYLLAFEVCRRRAPAVMAALAFAFSPFRIDHHGHLQVLMYAWMPAAFWALHRYFRAVWEKEGSRLKWLAIFVVVFLIQVLSSGYALFLLAVGIGLAMLWELGMLRPFRARVVVELTAATLAIFLAFSPVALMYLQARQTRGHGTPVQELDSYSAPLAGYWHVTPHVLLWRGVLPPGKGELRMFPGLTIVVLSAVALARLRRVRSTAAASETSAAPDRRLRGLCGFYVLLGLTGLLVSFGTPLQIGDMSVPGPYGWLAAVLPGMTALRVPARFVVLLLIALSVLASVGASALLARLRTSTRGVSLSSAVATVLACAALAEGFSGGVGLVHYDARGPSSDRLAYRWLEDRPPGALIELPINWEAGIRGTLFYQFAAIQHGRHIVNGYMRFGSALNSYLASAASPLYDLRYIADTIDALRAVGIRYIIQHPRFYEDKEHARATVAAIDGLKDQIEDREAFGDVRVWQLAPALPLGDRADGLLQIDVRGFRAAASHMPDRVQYAFDGNLRTRWLSMQRQTGDEWFELRLDRPRDVGRVVLRLDRNSGGDYPRILTVEGAGSDGTFRTLYHGAVLRQLLEALIRDGRDPGIRVDLQPNQTLTLRLRQGGQTRTWYWSMPELELWERARSATQLP